MLQSLSIENFKSIKATTLEFTFKENRAPSGFKDLDTWIFLDGGKNVRLVPCLAIYGPNASGKTNLVMALHTLRDVVLRGFFNGYVPNRIIPTGDAGVFTLHFRRKKKTFQYRIAFTASEILEEELVVNGERLFSIGKDAIDFSGIATEKLYTIGTLKKIRNVECLMDGKQIRSFLGRLGSQYRGLNPNIAAALDEFLAMHILPENNDSFFGGVHRLAQAASVPHEKSFARITELLATLDTGIARLRYELNPFSPEGAQPPVNLVRDKSGKFFSQRLLSYRKDIHGDEVEFDVFREESNGTRILTSLLGSCLYALERGATLVVDELDRSLHPWIFIEIVRLFKSKQHNKHNAQLVFTAHETELLDADLLRVSEVALVEKTLKKGTRVRRIADFEGMRNVQDLNRQYLSGAFGSLPQAYI